MRYCFPGNEGGRTRTEEVRRTSKPGAVDCRSNLYRLIDKTAASHQPILITGKRHDAVLISSEDWSAVQETMHLLSVPGMREAILEGMAEPIDECAKELDW